MAQTLADSRRCDILVALAQAGFGPSFPRLQAGKHEMDVRNPSPTVARGRTPLLMRGADALSVILFSFHPLRRGGAEAFLWHVSRGPRPRLLRAVCSAPCTTWRRGCSS